MNDLILIKKSLLDLLVPFRLSFSLAFVIYGASGCAAAPADMALVRFSSPIEVLSVDDNKNIDSYYGEITVKPGEHKIRACVVGYDPQKKKAYCAGDPINLHLPAKAGRVYRIRSQLSYIKGEWRAFLEDVTDGE